MQPLILIYYRYSHTHWVNIEILQYALLKMLWCVCVYKSWQKYEIITSAQGITQNIHYEIKTNADSNIKCCTLKCCTRSHNIQIHQALQCWKNKFSFFCLFFDLASNLFIPSKITNKVLSSIRVYVERARETERVNGIHLLLTEFI